MSQICRFRKSQTRAEGGTQERRPKTRLGSAAGCGPDERGWRLQAQRLTWNSTRGPAAAELSTCRWRCPQGSKTSTDLLMAHVTMLAWQPE